MIDGCRVIPYNHYLAGKYKTHINVEICGSVKAVIFTNIYTRL